jgi:hypothetical protein
MADHGHRRSLPGVATGLLWVLAGGAASEARAAGTWSMQAAAAYVEVSGHDPHVLAVRGGGGGDATALETESALGYRAAVLYDRGRWAYGLDFFIHRTDQGAGPLRTAATAGADQRVFELPHRSFASREPGEVLYFQTLEDTTVELWVVDLYARRQLAASGGRSLALLLGLRNSDFDNDYRAIAGIEAVGGTRIDASSNYSRLSGPLAGLAGTLVRGRHSLVADLRQSVVFGDVELTRTLRDFTGPPGPFAGPPEELPPGPIQARLATTDSITVPMTDLRLAWTVALGERWTLGASAGGTVWWDLAVPPGVVPARPDALETTDLVTYDVSAGVGFRF